MPMTHVNGTGTLASLRTLPKAEIHVHIEGAFEPSTLEKWSAEAGISMPRPRERLFEFKGLADFLHFLDWACGLVNTAERLAEMAMAVAGGWPMTVPAMPMSSSIRRTGGHGTARPGR